MAETWYVDPDAVGAGNGTSWEDAYTDLETALAAKEKDMSAVGVQTFLCRSGSGTADVDLIASVDSRANVDSSNYVLIDSDDFTSGVYDASAYRVYSASSTARDFLTIAVAYTRVDHIQFHHAGSRDYHEDIQINADNCIISNCHKENGS